MARGFFMASSIFERVGIRYLSPSSLNLFQELPALWAVRYLAKIRDDESPSAWRGKAVEAGLQHWLYKGEASAAEDVALNQYAALAAACPNPPDKEKADDEYDNLLPMLGEAMKAIPQAPPIAAQLKIECWLDGVPIPLMGFVDFVLEDGRDIDLKTTTRCPSEPAATHVRQCAIYHHARHKPISLVYVTAKKHRVIDLTDEQLSTALANLQRDARALERFLSFFVLRSDPPVVSPEVIAARCVSALPMNPDHFFWSETAKQAVATIGAKHAHSEERVV